MFDHIVVLILENHSLNEIYGSSSAPYLTGLANAWSLSQGYSAVDHPSEPNYLALVSGLAGDCSNSSPNIGACLSGGGDSTTDSGPTAPGGSYSSNAVNIVDRMESVGLTWDAYYEGSSGGCDQSFGTAYHASLLFMNDIVSSSNRCSHIHTFSTSTPTNLLTELNGGGANLIWINPDNSHNINDNIDKLNNLIRNADGGRTRKSSNHTHRRSFLKSHQLESWRRSIWNRIMDRTHLY